MFRCAKNSKEGWTFKDKTEIRREREKQEDVRREEERRAEQAKMEKIARREKRFQEILATLAPEARRLLEAKARESLLAAGTPPSLIREFGINAELKKMLLD